MRRRRYGAMRYVYKRPEGLFQIRYPIPIRLRSYFPNSEGIGFKKHIIVSLGTRDQSEANRSASPRMLEIEQKLSLLDDGVQSEHFRFFCQYIYDVEMDRGTHRRLDSSLSAAVLDADAQILRDALRDRSVSALEASVGWVVDFYFQNGATATAIVPTDTELRNGLLNAAADVLTDVHTQLAASVKGLTHKPRINSVHLQPTPEPKVSAGENTPLSKEGMLSLEKYWDIYETTKQGSSSPLKPHTLERGKTAWYELRDLLGASLPIFKVTKAHIWEYHAALVAAPARAGVITELKALSFPERVDAMKLNPEAYSHLHLNTVGDRLRLINSIFQLAVKRGHLENNPAAGVSEGKTDGEKYRNAYSEKELQLIFSSPPFDIPCRLEHQTDEFWLPLLAVFLGARSSEMYVRTEDVDLDDPVPHIKLVEFDERSLKNGPSSRLLPIHPKLVELGFIEFCRSAKTKGELLFPMWVFREDQKPSEGSARRRFNKHLTKLLPDRGYPADSHTFRHNFETALSASHGVPERIMLRLSGRTVPGSAAGYLHDVPILPDLASAVAKVRYGDLSLKHLC